MPQKKHTIATVDRRKSGQSIPLGDTGDGDTGVPNDEQGISNRPSDEDADEQNRDDEEDEDELAEGEQEEEEEESETTFGR